MSKKKKTPDQYRAERKHLNMVSDKPIKEIYPNVGNISISYKTFLIGAGGWKETPVGPHIYGPDDKTLFDYDCPHIHCVGSFDLADVIRDMIRGHESKHSGKKICQYIVRDHPCWVEFDYIINVNYKT